MQRKKLKLGILVMAAVTLFTATAFAAGTAGDGYEALKQIIKESRRAEALKSVSLNGSLQISDNGKILAGLDGTVKADKEAELSNGNVKVDLNGTKQELSFFQNGEDVFLTDVKNTKYYKLVNTEHANNRRNTEYRNDEYSCRNGMGAVEESILDYFVGDLKSQFKLSTNADGTKTISMDLNQNEIPMPLNLLTAAAAGNMRENYGRCDKSEISDAQKQLLIEKLPFLKDYFDADKIVMPSLKENVKITKLAVKMDVDAENRLKAVAADIHITGNDKDGVYHDIALQGLVSVSGINKTNADRFNQEGKKLEIINAEDFEAADAIH